MSDLPANAAWLAWLVGAACALYGLLGLVQARMTFAIPFDLGSSMGTRRRNRFRREVSGNLARGLGIGFIVIGALALASIKAGAVVAAVAGAAGWFLGSAVEEED